ncbi:MAG: 2-C-methyl-D-erythritol 4-phosphate cytidylyltransferase [Actinomycetia bacterium]|nr:2-C-methyl-D-erythritol 4-phosphate cytidylyltransferase [Actinomycetes bacterium]
MDNAASSGAPARVWCVVVAAGSGRRFGAPKQFAELGGSTVLGHSVTTAAQACDGVVVVVPADEVEACRAMVPGADVVVSGGSTRSESSRAGVEAVPDEAEVILVHDGARPLATPGLFTRVTAAVDGGADGAVPVVPLADTIRDREGTLVDRDNLVAIQTPQGFVAATLRDAVRGGGEATDDAALVAEAGGTVEFVDGESANRKVTTPEDLVIAQALMQRAGLQAERGGN